VNANNKGYCRTMFDEDSLKFLVSNLSKINNTPNRCYLWRTFADQVKLQKLKPKEYLECIYNHLPYEEEE
jgi:hypothetical protein